MDSISPGFNWEKSSDSTPSIITNGAELFFENEPRNFIFQLSSPGAAELRVIMTPGTCPCKACAGLERAPLSFNILSLTTVTAPVSVSFFCAPYPTTTTSSSTSVLSFIVTFSTAFTPASIIWSS